MIQEETNLAVADNSGAKRLDALECWVDMVKNTLALAM